MADIAQSAVLVHSSVDVDLDTLTHHPGATANPTERPHRPQLNVCGPKDSFDSVEHILSHYATLGFQASHLGQAVEIGKKMITKQPPSTIYMIQNGDFVKVEPEQQPAAADEDAPMVYPTLFLGITATLMGTGCREAVRFLVQEGVAPREACDAHSQPSATEISFARLKHLFGNYAATRLFPEGAEEAALPDGPERFAPVGAHRSFLSAVVMAGGGPEHDLRRACQPYHLSHYASEAPSTTSAPPSAAPATKSGHPAKKTSTAKANAGRRMARFGNVLYASSFPGSLPSSQPAPEDTSLFDGVMQTLARLLCERQADLKATAAQRPAQAQADAMLDGTAYCSWSTTPSEVWALAGLWLEDMLAFVLAKGAAEAAKKRRAKTPKPSVKVTASRRAPNPARDAAAAAAPATAKVTQEIRAEARRRAQSTVLYWAARQEVSIFCPSFADGDMAQYLYAQLHKSATQAATTTAAPEVPTAERMLKLDLVRDIHGINKLAMYSKRTGMILCGGGSVKHHVCNANLMRNGADYTIFVSNGQEFDGSDAGARPEEAISWGKIRCDGEAVKVYSEVTVVLPLLVAEVFVPAVRARDDPSEAEKNSAFSSESTRHGGS